MHGGVSVRLGRISQQHIKATTFEQENPSARITKMLVVGGADLVRIADDGTPAMYEVDVEFCITVTSLK